MSSQSQGIPLHHASDTNGYRLIELPPELASLLESESPPTLTLENSEACGSATLKSPTTTYSMRQKNTSNALMLLSPLRRSSSETTGTATPEHEEGLAAIATVHETMELEPVPEGGSSAMGGMKHTGSKGKWHERFGRNR